MKERPIIFSAQDMRSILAETKTQTRRVVKAPGWEPGSSDYTGRMQIGLSKAQRIGLQAYFEHRETQTWHGVRCPYGQPGDRLWVREAFMHEPADYCWEASVSIPCRPAVTVYRADHDDRESRGAGWKPSIHMPRSLSRITLEVTGVRVERLQDISEADAIAEGVDPAEEPNPLRWQHYSPHGVAYAALWEQINGPGSWDANPWVWVIAFERVEAGHA